MEENEMFEEECGDEEYPSHRPQSHQKIQQRNKRFISSFLGNGKRHTQATIVPPYYGKLLAWALQRHIERDKWEVIRNLGYRESEPVFSEVQTSCEAKENLLTNGQLFLAKGKSRLIVTMDAGYRGCLATVDGSIRLKKRIGAFIDSVIKISKEENFYRGKKLELGAGLRFLDVKPKDWDTIILDNEYKKEIRANTVEFLRQSELWQELGIPTKRGLVLSGEPGTGKTIVCRAIMGEAVGITCISTSAYDMAEGYYVSALYEIAQDLSPCIVLIEDIELIGQSRSEFGMDRSSALIALLSEMDGIEPKKEIVTVATTNCVEVLDKALSHRPSRFDRVINFECPVASERATLVDNLCKKITLDGTAREYIVRHTDGFTPAQIQEVVFGLAIEYGRKLGSTEIKSCDISRIISRINGTKRKQLGFNHVDDSQVLGCQNPNIQNNVSKDV